MVRPLSTLDSASTRVMLFRGRPAPPPQARRPPRPDPLPPVIAICRSSTSSLAERRSRRRASVRDNRSRRRNSACRDDTGRRARDVDRPPDRLAIGRPLELRWKHNRRATLGLRLLTPYTRATEGASSREHIRLVVALNPSPGL